MTDYQSDEFMAKFNQIKRAMLDIVYGSGYEITLDSGRILTMISLVQYQTYRGMLEGMPTRKRNDERIDYPPESKTYVLHAPRLHGDICKMLPPDSYMARRCAEDPYEVLPGVTCVAKMKSAPCETHALNDIEPPDISSLTLVWFQNEWAMPIDPEVLNKLRAFDWDAHAYNQGI